MASSTCVSIPTAVGAPTAERKPQTPQRTCHACGTQGVLSRCGGCRAVYFCGLQCQRRAWPTHRPSCLVQGVQRANRAPVLPAKEQETDVQTNEKSDRDTQQSKGEVETQKALIDAESIRRETGAGGLKNRKKPCSGQQKDVQERETRTECTPSVSEATACSKASKKKKKKKKKRSTSVHTPRSAPLAGAMKPRSISLSARKNVRWGEVHERRFARLPGGGGAVPYEGTWALGLGRLLEDVKLGSVVDVEETRLEQLKERVKHLPKAKRANVREGETRQFDYRRGANNPLFSRLSERERKKLLISTEDVQKTEPPHHPVSRHSSVSSTSSTSSECEEENQHVDFARLSMEQQNEFSVIRESRDEACGCSCGDLVKKVSKMNVKKLHGFLTHRNLPTKGKSKPELLALAKAIAMQEKNCTNAERCECVANGIACHQLACGGCVQDCHNPHETYQYHRAEVVKYRQKLLAMCEESPDGLPHAPPSAF